MSGTTKPAKPITIRKHSVEARQGTYAARESEVWFTATDGHTRLAVVIRPIDGSLDAVTRKLARICAKALNDDLKQEKSK